MKKSRKLFSDFGLTFSRFQKNEVMKTIILGLDEAGRGPWAGPLVVAGIASEKAKIFDKILDLNDSKKLSEKKRKMIFANILELEKGGEIHIFREIISAEKIDEIGIREANRSAMAKIITSAFELFSNEKIQILIDGSDNFDFSDFFPGQNIFYQFAFKKHQKNAKKLPEMGNFCEDGQSVKIQFIIGGDASEKIISAASIIAKVTRDSLMEGYSREFPEYEFDKHKGYGTKKHREAILNYGINFLYRKSYEPIKTLISRDTGLL